MNYSVAITASAERDLELIFRFLAQTYHAFGERRKEARARAEKRIGAILRLATALGAAPHQGTRRDTLRPGLRSVTKDQAIFYFNVDDDQRQVRVLAVFFGGQDHQREMVKRLRGD